MQTKMPENSLFVIATILVSALAGCAGGETFEPYQREDTNTVTIPGGQGIEFKLFVREGDSFQYTWSAGRSLKFDFHGELEGDKSGAFTSHKAGSAASDSGGLKVPFTGTHGWYWENTGAQAATVTIKTEGVYDIVGETGKKH